MLSTSNQIPQKHSVRTYRKFQPKSQPQNHKQLINTVKCINLNQQVIFVKKSLIIKPKNLSNTKFVTTYNKNIISNLFAPHQTQQRNKQASLYSKLYNLTHKRYQSLCSDRTSLSSDSNNNTQNSNRNFQNYHQIPQQKQHQQPYLISTITPKQRPSNRKDHPLIIKPKFKVIHSVLKLKNKAQKQTFMMEESLIVGPWKLDAEEQLIA